MTRIAVLGGGSWGTALAWLLGRNGHAVTLWCRDSMQAEELRRTRRNRRYLPELDLPPDLTPTADLHAAAEAQVVVFATPAAAMLTLAPQVAALPGRRSVVIAAKGLEPGSGRRLSEALTGLMRLDPGQLAVLSGPNLAGEIVRGVPTATVIASASRELAGSLQQVFGAPHFRVYTNSDVAGVELGGALKNPVAIAGGICDGLGLGNNTKAGLLTRGLAEITRLGVAAGARAATFSGLSGLGDLLATAYSPLSRNHRVGVAIGQGLSVADAVVAVGQTAEGIPTTAAVRVLRERLGIETPLLDGLFDVLFHELPAARAVERLLARPPREEAEPGW